MNTSSKAALDPEWKVSGFPYADVTSLPATEGVVPASVSMEEEIARREQAARDAGRMEGAGQMREVLASEATQLRDSIPQALIEFARERKSYYDRVEGEVVQLALAIARKILHRESQLDPLLLAGIVRVALEKIDSGTRITLRVDPQHATEWRTYFAQHVQPEQIPEVLEDRTLEPGRCVLETSIGATDLGVEPQLKEIEKGLFDLMAARAQTR